MTITFIHKAIAILIIYDNYIIIMYIYMQVVTDQQHGPSWTATVDGSRVTEVRGC